MTKTHTQVLKVFERWGCGGRKAFSKKVFFPRKKNKKTKKGKSNETKKNNDIFFKRPRKI